MNAERFNLTRRAKAEAIETRYDWAVARAKRERETAYQRLDAWEVRHKPR